mmetsp:Transcript_11318/g.18366  ORF Transcript_11318/g.18366 Transcript_11318/m.18366 type:complete len:100 (+) Transcript_11318:2320-2619(+)
MGSGSSVMPSKEKIIKQFCSTTHKGMKKVSCERCGGFALNNNEIQCIIRAALNTDDPLDVVMEGKCVSSLKRRAMRSIEDEDKVTMLFGIIRTTLKQTF